MLDFLISPAYAQDAAQADPSTKVHPTRTATIPLHLLLAIPTHPVYLKQV